MYSGDLRNKTGYQEIILINGLDKIVENSLQHYGINSRVKKSALGYFYNTKEKIIYANELFRCAYGGAFNPIKIEDYQGFQTFFNNLSESHQLLEIYKHTKFLINTYEDMAWFSFRFLPKDKKFLSRPFAIISAENQNMKQQDDESNEINNTKLKVLLQKSGLEFYTSVGELDGYFEKCFIVFNIELQASLNIGQEFNQSSIVYNNTATISIVDCETKNILLEYDFEKKYNSKSKR